MLAEFEIIFLSAQHRNCGLVSGIYAYYTHPEPKIGIG